MALSDPELDLLKELLEDDPADEAFLQVGEELIRRGDFDDAEQILAAALAEDPDHPQAWEWLARACLETGSYEGAVRAAETALASKPSAEAARVRAMAYERSGRVDEASAAADAFVEQFGDDPVIEALRERVSAPSAGAIEPSRSMPDPMLSPKQAERYIEMGRADRAVRVYRRILFHQPDNREVINRLRVLEGVPHDYMEDDLSEELPDPNIVPPDLVMPEPALNRAVGGADTPAGLQAFVESARRAEEASMADEEETDLRPADPNAIKKRKRRRRLLGKG